MIGVLIVAGILFYALLYTGVQRYRKVDVSYLDVLEGKTPTTARPKGKPATTTRPGQPGGPGSGQQA